jgi:hypothetical protein
VHDDYLVLTGQDYVLCLGRVFYILFDSYDPVRVSVYTLIKVSMDQTTARLMDTDLIYHSESTLAHKSTSHITSLVIIPVKFHQHRILSSCGVKLTSDSSGLDEASGVDGTLGYRSHKVRIKSTIGIEPGIGMTGKNIEEVEV